MSADQQILEALADVLARVSHEISSTNCWVTEIKSGRQSAELLKCGVSKRDVKYRAGGANSARRRLWLGIAVLCRVWPTSDARTQLAPCSLPAA